MTAWCQEKDFLGRAYSHRIPLAILQRKADALALLKKAKEVGFPNLDWAARDPDLACLRDEPEFQRLIHAGPQKA